MNGAVRQSQTRGSVMDKNNKLNSTKYTSGITDRNGTDFDNLLQSSPKILGNETLSTFKNRTKSHNMERLEHKAHQKNMQSLNLYQKQLKASTNITKNRLAFHKLKDPSSQIMGEKLVDLEAKEEAMKNTGFTTFRSQS